MRGKDIYKKRGVPRVTKMGSGHERADSESGKWGRDEQSGKAIESSGVGKVSQRSVATNEGIAYRGV